MAMFRFNEHAVTGETVSAALGVDANNKLVQADVGKPVKLAGADNYVVCADGDEIEGFVSSVEPPTVNNGFSFGGVTKRGRFKVKASGALAVGDLVVAGAQAALGTAGQAVVKKGTDRVMSDGTAAGVEQSPNIHIWRVISLLGGAGADGSEVLIEKV